MKTIADLYRQWWDKVKPAGNVPPIQVEEMRRSFYSGAFALLTEIRAGVVGDDAATEEQAIDQMVAWDAELTRYFRGLIAGHAAARN